MIAQIMSITSVVSCTASNIRRKNVFGGFGGISLRPNAAARNERSLSSSDRPKRDAVVNETNARRGVLTRDQVAFQSLSKTTETTMDFVEFFDTVMASGLHQCF